MNITQKNRFARLKRVRAMLKRYEAEWQNDAALVIAVEQMDNEITFLNEADNLTGSGTKHITNGKNAQLELLIEQLLWLAGVLYSWADDNHDAELKSLCTVTHSDFRNQESHDFTRSFRVLVEKATYLGEDSLGKYGMDAEGLQSFQTLALEMDSTLGNPLLCTADLKALRKEITLRLRKVRTFLKHRVRNLLMPFRSKNVGLWEAFEAAMVIIDRKAGHPPSADDVVVE